MEFDPASVLKRAMALPTTREMREFAAKAIVEHMADQERTIRELLGQWVSELEPEIIYSYAGITRQLVGIGMKGDPSATVVIENPRFRPADYSFVLRDIGEGSARVQSAKERAFARLGIDYKKSFPA